MFSAFLLVNFVGDWVVLKVISIFSDNTSESIEAASATPSTGEFFQYSGKLG
jgi:hypothetical protein